MDIRQALALYGVKTLLLHNITPHMSSPNVKNFWYDRTRRGFQFSKRHIRQICFHLVNIHLSFQAAISSWERNIRRLLSKCTVSLFRRLFERGYAKNMTTKDFNFIPVLNSFIWKESITNALQRVYVSVVGSKSPFRPSLCRAHTKPWLHEQVHMPMNGPLWTT